MEIASHWMARKRERMAVGLSLPEKEVKTPALSHKTRQGQGTRPINFSLFHSGDGYINARPAAVQIESAMNREANPTKEKFHVVQVDIFLLAVFRVHWPCSALRTSYVNLQTRA